MIVIATVAALAGVAALTFTSGRKVGLAACALVALIAIAASGFSGDRGMLRDISLGALLGLPVLIAAIVALDRKTKRAGSPPA